MASSSFWADRFPMRSSSATLPASRKYRSPGVFTRPAFTRFSTTAIPSPSMSMASRLAKWARLRSSWAGHSAPVQRMWAPSSSRSTGAPHTGQVWGKR